MKIAFVERSSTEASLFIFIRRFLNGEVLVDTSNKAKGELAHCIHCKFEQSSLYNFRLTLTSRCHNYFKRALETHKSYVFELKP